MVWEALVLSARTALALFWLFALASTSWAIATVLLRPARFGVRVIGASIVGVTLASLLFHVLLLFSQFNLFAPSLIAIGSIVLRTVMRRHPTTIGSRITRLLAFVPWWFVVPAALVAARALAVPPIGWDTL